MYTIVKLPTFTADAKAIWSEDDRGAFCAWLSGHPTAGDVIPGSGGCRKVRWARAGSGKSGGVRVIYFNRLESGVIYLMVIYAKAVFRRTCSKPLKRRFIMANEKFMTGEELGQKLLAAAREMTAGAGRVVYSPTIAARTASGLSQAQFAQLLGVSVRTLQDWEQGRREPSGAARTLLRVAQAHPEVLRELLAPEEL